jgi:cytochrome d ubiquinol oxidase subunit I
MLSWLIYGDSSKPVTGLKEFKPEDRPPVNFVFQTYHAMVGIGCALIGLSVLGALFWWRGTLFEKRWLLWLLVFSVLGPQLANQLGWFSAEVGRQPWIVYGLLRTSEGLSKVVTANMVVTSLILFTVIYALLFAVFVYLLNDKIQHGPDAADLTPTGKLALPERP